MFVIRNEDIAGSEREVHCPKGKFVSFRYLLKSDGVGFGLHRTEIPKGPRCRWRYKNHNEACYCVSGRGIFTNATDGSVHLIQPGSCYVVLKEMKFTMKTVPILYES